MSITDAWLLIDRTKPKEQLSSLISFFISILLCLCQLSHFACEHRITGQPDGRVFPYGISYVSVFTRAETSM